MRVKQAEGQQSTDQQQQTSLWTYLGAGGAAAAAGSAAWTYSNSSSTSAAPIDPMRLAHAPPRAQAAVGAACAGPLLHLQHALNPTPAQLQGIAAALAAEAASLGPELVTGLWGLAMFGAVLPQQQLARLAGSVIEQIPQLPVYEAIVAGELKQRTRCLAMWRAGRVLGFAAVLLGARGQNVSAGRKGILRSSYNPPPILHGIAD
jgi:hypothetical protein